MPDIHTNIKAVTSKAPSTSTLSKWLKTTFSDPMDWPIRTWRRTKMVKLDRRKNEWLYFIANFHRNEHQHKISLKLDRAKNRYPALDFPELYLLKDGYKVIILTFHSKISSFWLILIHFWARNELVWSFRNALRVRLLFLARNWLISIEPMSLFCDFFVWSPKLGYFENFLFELKIRLLTAPFISTQNRLISQFSSFQPKLIIFGQNLIFIFRHSSMENRPSVQQRAHTFQCLIRDTLKNWDDFVKNAKHYHHQKSNNCG